MVEKRQLYDTKVFSRPVLSEVCDHSAIICFNRFYHVIDPRVSHFVVRLQYDVIDPLVFIL